MVDGSNVDTVVVDGSALSELEVVAVARDGAGVRLADRALDALAVTRARIDELAASDVPAYGISTGFGALATRHIPVERRQQLQRSLVRSHAASSGPEVDREVIRAPDAAAAPDADDGPDGCTSEHGAGIGRPAVRRADARRAHLRQPRVLGRPRAAGPRRAQPHGRG